MAQDTPPLAVVTGASGGIGSAVCLNLVRSGYTVVAVGRAAGRLAPLVARTAEGAVRVVECDVTSEEGVRGLAAGLGPIRVLVHAAGAADSAPLAKVTLGQWHELMLVNATSSFLFLREFLPGMRERGDGRVVVVASTAAIRGEAYTAAYTASKHAVLGLVRAAAAEVAGSGVTVNAVCPTYVDTPMTAATVAKISAATGRPADEVVSRLVRGSRLGRLLEPAEVTAAVGYLLDAGGGVNGQALVLDGG